MVARTKITQKKQAEFLECLARGDTVVHAAALTAIPRAYWYEERKISTAFAAEWDTAIEAGTEQIEQELKRRAVDGYDEPVWYKGDEVGVVRKFSDTLLMFMLKGRNPAKYRENTSIEHSGEIGQRVQIREIVIE